MKQIGLNISREQAKAFIDFLANEGYWGQTFTDFDLQHGAEETEFIINGHRLSNYSNQHHHVVIDDCYVGVQKSGRTHVGEKCYSNMDYALMRLGF